MNKFIYGCIPARILLIFISYYICHHHPVFLPYLALPAIALSIGFITIYTMGWRKTGIETEGKPIWWNTIRPVHAFFYLMFAYSVFRKSKNAWVWLLIDVLSSSTISE